MDKSKLFGKNLEAGIVLISVVVLALFSAAYLNLTGFAVHSDAIIEKTIQIEVLADSYIHLESKQDSIIVRLVLDNGTVIEEQDLELYLDNERLQSQNKSLFSLSEVSPGIHSVKVNFQGSSSQFINPSELESQIEVKNGSVTLLNENAVKVASSELSGNIIGGPTEDETLYEQNTPIVNDSNETVISNSTNISNISNSTSITLEIPAGISCKEFTENVLWSSNYSNNDLGSTNYQTWHLKNNCTSAEIDNCFIGSVHIKTRFVYMGENNQQGSGYIQISEPNQTICENPQNGNYQNYLAYETLIGEERKFGEYCGNNKNSDEKCGVDYSDRTAFSNCYGIKSHADKNFLVDAFEVNYTLCGGNQ